MERGITIPLENTQLLGVLHVPNADADIGVLVIVGGPQYRVGSHRQFVQLSRALAEAGVPSLRFDYRGMGDSEGDKRDFVDIDEDIRAACDVLQAEAGVQRIVLWGLCDAASAAMMYAPRDSRVAGLVLLNPWLRSEEAMGRVMVRHYYMKRLWSAEFWRKLLGGGVRLLASARDAAGHLGRSLRSKGQGNAVAYQQRMQVAMQEFTGPLCLVLSGDDLTAREFAQQALGGEGWPVFHCASARVCHLEGADHTCSSGRFKREVESLTIELVASVAFHTPPRNGTMSAGAP